MRHFMAQFGPGAEAALDEAGGAGARPRSYRPRRRAVRRAGGRPLASRELERLRDDCLVDIMRALEKYRVGAGAVLAEDPLTAARDR